jgi:hypothetical protein
VRVVRQCDLATRAKNACKESECFSELGSLDGAVSQNICVLNSLVQNYCISQRDSLHDVPLPRIEEFIGQGLDVAIQAERETAMSVFHLPDH